MFRAAKRGDAKLLAMLLLESADVDRQTRDEGWSPLFIAAREGHAPVMRLLVRAGCDVDAVTNDGWTAAMIAAHHNRVGALELLVEACRWDVRMHGERGD